MRVGLLGGGVIGGGWAARFLLNGHDVDLYDPDPDAPRKVERLLENARRAQAKLTAAPLPGEGSLRVIGTVEEAVAAADLVQESAPERLELKRDLLAAAGEAAAGDVIVASSTSGLLPSELQSRMRNPERFLVAHPFNPVYLLPLVELCGGARTAAATITRAAELYRGVGMEPLHVRNEIDGFISDRLLEALWREALWLVHDGVATVEEVDDAIRYGPGLRWSIMGTFQIYRIAGGEDGVRHFMAQFGPALRWPWTKLTDVPELTDEFLDRLERESDAQADGLSISDLERLRDDCLVGVLQALRGRGVGAGETQRRYEAALRARAPAQSGADGPLLRLHSARVAADWIDYNGHATESAYLRVAGETTDLLLALVGIDDEYLRQTGSYYTVETHLRHLGQAVEGDILEVTTQVLGADAKRLHVMHRIVRGADVLATAEQMLLHVDAHTGRAGPARADVLASVDRLAADHGALPPPDGAGRRVGMTVSAA